MRKKIFTIVATFIVASFGVLGLASPAQAEQITTIDTWDTSVTPNAKGGVVVESVISPITAGETLDIAFPITASWDAIEGWNSEKKLNYAYTDFVVSKGYDFKVTPSEGVWAVLSIASNPAEGEQTLPLTFSYITHNSIYNIDGNKKQQMNLPLVDESFGSTISKYTVNVSKTFGAEKICLRNAATSSKECLPATETETAFVTEIDRKAGERLSLRTSYPVNAFNNLSRAKIDTETGKVIPDVLAAPENYLREFKSWKADATVNSDGTTNIVNTIVYDATKTNSNNIVIAYDVTNVDNDKVYKYTDFALSGDSVNTYALAVEKDNYKVYPDGHYVLNISKKPVIDEAGNEIVAETVVEPETGLIEPKFETVTFSYTTDGFTTNGASTNEKTQGQEAKLTEIVVKSASPKIAVENIQLSLDKALSPTPTGGNSVCSADRGKKYDCTTSEDGFVYKASGNINTDFFVVYEFASDSIALNGAPVIEGEGNTVYTSEPVVTILDSPIVGVIGQVIFILGVLVLSWFLFRKINLKSLAKIAGDSSAGLYKTFANKPVYFIPSESNIIPKNAGSKKARKAQKNDLNTTFAKSNERGSYTTKTFTPPKLDNGKEISPYIYPFLSQTDENTAMLTSGLSLIMSLAAKDAVRIVHDKNGRAGIDVQPGTAHIPLTLIERVTLQEIIDNTNKDGKPILSPRLLEKITTNNRLSKMIITEVKELKLYEFSGGLLAKGNTARTVGTGVSAVTAIASGAAIVGGMLTGGLLPILAGAVGLVASSAGFGKSAVKLGQKQKIRTATGTGYLARMEAFRNYFNVARPESRYSVERADIDSKYLPWAVVFDLPQKWVNVFSASTSASGKNVLIAGNSYPSDVLGNSLDAVISSIKTRSNMNLNGKGPLLNPDRL